MYMHIFQCKNHRTSPLSNDQKVATNVDFERGATMSGRHQNSKCHVNPAEKRSQRPGAYTGRSPT
jgi:hypothetical protein